MWDDNHWQPITAEDVVLSHRFGGAAYYSGLFMCSLCGQYVSLANGEKNRPEIKHKVSGLGNYRKTNHEDAPSSVVRMFQLAEDDLETRWNNLIANITEWRKTQPGTNTEYLRMEPPFTISYWINRPYKNKGISIMRSGIIGTRVYYLYKYDGKDILVYQLPDWQTADSEYLNLSNACLYVNGVFTFCEILC